QAVMGHPVLAQALRLDGVICVVDAVNGQATLDAHHEAVRQVAVADRIVVTKSELADAETLSALSARLRELNPRAARLPAAGADAAALVDCGLYDPETRTADVRRWLGEDAHDHHDDHDHDHDHDHHRHDHRVRSM